MGLIERLRNTMPPHYGKCRQAADALERLRGYAVHDDDCTTHPQNLACSCGLTALLRELTDG